MNLEIFDIFDSATGSYARPFFMLSKGEATRAFVDIINDETTSIHKHPEDFTLFHLGAFNQETAEFKILLTPSSMGKAIQYVLDGHAHDVWTENPDHPEGRPLTAGVRLDPLDIVENDAQPLSNGD